MGANDKAAATYHGHPERSELHRPPSLLARIWWCIRG
ncbi:hypothetical protein I5I01_gp91 [Mycobacterium phage MooMoo]|uniref:Uncharacterized protein n=1 Tax=Mycobacterium phage MooMoo TaxID=2108127 RepID=A0A2P1JRB1_9CAUD|nr:hypothetical protein I5I01_gp91 [Mycobacterium phage MooMoo]AVO21696.1 hypothetical protein SEA_MOOMOO_91 [Mycobacterium phage MooMoo]